MDEIRHVLASQNELGEGPLWDAVAQAVYWVDIEVGRFHRWVERTGEHSIVEVGEKLGALALREGGGLVMALQHGFAFWDEDARTLERIGDPERGKPGTQFNDGAVDRKGRFWAGTLGDPFKNSLYRLDLDHSIHRMETGIDVSNGIGWSPNGRVMYYVDSTPCAIYAYDFDLDSGAIANRRVFVDGSAGAGVFDGLTVDREGCIWSARWGGWCVERYDPAGKLMRTLKLPVPQPTSVMFGGPELEELYITSAWMELSQAELAQAPLSGDLFCAYVGVGGLPEPAYKG